MKLRQTIVIVSCALIGILLWVLPRTALSAKSSPEPTSVDSEGFESQVEILKKELSVTDLKQVSAYETNLKNASSAVEKAAYYDSLAAYWDHKMRPGIGAEYAFLSAEQTNNTKSWLQTGKRFLGLSGFFSPEEKEILVRRAVDCFERAHKIDSLNSDVKTNLGIAYTQSGEHAMKGIQLLLGVVKDDPANYEAQFSLGVFSMQSGQYEKAVERFKKVIALRQDVPELRLYLSDALTGAGELQEARRELLGLKSATNDTFLIREVDQRLKQIK